MVFVISNKSGNNLSVGKFLIYINEILQTDGTLHWGKLPSYAWELTKPREYDIAFYLGSGRSSAIHSTANRIRTTI